jgi:hypothetical protein
MAKSIAVALFTRDLRVHDNPVLTAAAEADTVIPLFVLDSAIAAYAVPTGPISWLRASPISMPVCVTWAPDWWCAADEWFRRCAPCPRGG